MRAPGWVALIGLIVACSPAKPRTPVEAIDVPGVEREKLTTREQRDLDAALSELPAPCADQAVPLGQCLKEQRPCKQCLPAARAVAKSVHEGMAREQIDAYYKNRWDPAGQKKIPLEGSPSRGPENAPVVLVEFADFECPACERMFPAIEKAVEEHKDSVRFVYKFLPLPLHPHADPAARAAIAAGQQGKFWEMHHKLFSSFGKLEQSDLEKHATELQLNVEKLRADMNARATTARIEADRQLADELDVRQTPTLYINGRRYDYSVPLGTWIKEEIESRR